MLIYKIEKLHKNNINMINFELENEQTSTIFKNNINLILNEYINYS